MRKYPRNSRILTYMMSLPWTSRQKSTVCQRNIAQRLCGNYHGFISAVLGILCPNLRICTTLPQKVKNEPYIPSDEGIRQILEYANGLQFEIPIILACYGLRRSEICALTPDDIDGDTVKIRKTKVLNDKTEWVNKTTKTTASTKEIIIPMEIAEQIRNQGYVYKGHPNSITIYLSKAEDRIGLQHFSMHKLRHYFASKMSTMSIPDEDIMRMGKRPCNEIGIPILND